MWLETAKDPSPQELFRQGPETKALWICKNQLCLKNELLFYQWEDEVFPKELYEVPVSLREAVLQQCHNMKTAGHLGQAKTLSRLRGTFLWPKVRSDVETYVKSSN
jgi:hypothetical protein